MRGINNRKMRASLWAVFGMICFASILVSPSAWAESGCFIDKYGTRGCPVGPEPVGPGGNPGGHTGPTESEIRERQERAERNARYDAIYDQYLAASERGDYREALRLLRAGQKLRDGSVTRRGIAKLEKYLADQANIERGDNLNQQANSAQASGDHKQALKLYKQALATYPDPTSEYRQYVADFEKRVERMEKENNERLKREAKAAERERRHRPKVERLRAEATALVDANPAEARAKLDAALKLLPGDTKTTGDWWLANASLALLEGRYDAAFEALEKTKGYGLDAGEIARWQGRIKDERARQGSEVQNAFADLRQRLAATPVGTDPGALLLSIHQSSKEALSSPVAEKDLMTPGRADQKMAGEGFDIPGTNQGTLVYPDKNNHRPPPSVLDRQIPAGAKDDPQIKQMQTWYRSLEGQKAEKEQKIAEIKEQQKTSQDPVLATKIATLVNDVKRLNDDQGNATKTVKKRVLDMGLAWDEGPSPEPPATAESVKKPSPESAELEFIQN
jgi:tetratricopeptide (TPR) repeat protein